MANSEVKLIGAWPSPYVMRPRIALNLKNIDYEFLEESFGSKSELLLKSNPVHKKIPVLIHNDKPICESLIIVEYIDEVWSSDQPILGSDPYDRAMARFWAAYIDEKWFPNLKGLAAAQGEEETKQKLTELGEGLVLLEEAFHKLSKGKPFFGGDKIGYLDIAFGCFLGWIRVSEKMNGIKLIDGSKTPGLFKWSVSFTSDPAVESVMPDADNLAEFAKVLMAKLKGGGSAK